MGYSIRRWESGGRSVSIGVVGGLIIAAIVLWMISLGSLGYVSIIGWAAESWASLPLMLRGPAALIAAGFILIFIAAAMRGSGARRGLAILSIVLIVIGFITYFAGYVVMLNSNPSKIRIIRLKHPMDTTSSRLVPLHTAYAYAVSMLQTPTHTIYEDESYVYYDREGHIIYNWIVEPEGFWNEISKKPLGVVLVNGSIYPPKVYVIKDPLTWGLHRLIITPFYVDNLWREIKLRAGLGLRVLMDCNVEVVRNGKAYIIIPLATWRVTSTTSIPVPAGFMVIDENGSMRYVSFREAQHDPLFNGIPLVPEVIAREWVMIYRYYTGFWNVVLYHNTYVIRNVGTNPQPYLMTDNKGHLYWVFIAEPPGMTYAAKYIFYVNASDPNPHIMMYELPHPVIGISRIASLIKQKHPTYDWSQFMVEEPMPIIVNGTLYWKVTVITRDGRGLVSVDLVNTKTNEVYSIKPNGTLTMNQVIAYLKGNVTAIKHPSKGGLSAVLTKIQELRKKILKQEEELRKLYNELGSLESLVKKLASNKTATNTTRT